MPLTEKGRKIKAAMIKEYGEKKGTQVFYAWENKHKDEADLVVKTRKHLKKALGCG